MKHFPILMAGCALLTMSGVAAYADCAEDLAAFEGAAMADNGIAKDGSLAPLEEDGTAAGSVATESGPNEIAKDGSTAPLAEEAATGAPDVATSGQDVQAEQAGGEPAAVAAESDTSARDDALARARSALAAGDEDACAAALEEARSL